MCTIFRCERVDRGHRELQRDTRVGGEHVRCSRFRNPRARGKRPRGAGWQRGCGAQTEVGCNGLGLRVKEGEGDGGRGREGRGGTLV